MTNLVLTTTLSLTLSTNWVGQINNQEVGFRVTNYHAQVIFEDTTNTMKLKEVVCKEPLFRPYEQPKVYYITNSTHNWRFIYPTNL